MGIGSFHLINAMVAGWLCREQQAVIAWPNQCSERFGGLLRYYHRQAV
jgi:hypothetical protein